MKSQVEHYKIYDERIAKPGVRILFFSDMHGSSCPVLEQYLSENRPDLILVGGDVIHRLRAAQTLRVLKRCARTAPTIYAYGNHETKRLMPEREYYQQAAAFMNACKRFGITILNNGVKHMTVKGTPLNLVGNTQSLDCFRRLGAGKSGVNVRHPDDRDYCILLSHSPSDPQAYAAWGADLTLSGHYHGGVLRLGQRGLLTPQLRLFEKYCHGMFELGPMKLIVTSGCGEKCFPPRILNPVEICEICLKPKEAGGSSPV